MICAELEAFADEEGTLDNPLLLINWGSSHTQPLRTPLRTLPRTPPGPGRHRKESWVLELIIIKNKPQSPTVPLFFFLIFYFFYHFP